MSGVVRGDGIGLEITESVVRGVRLRHDAEGRLTGAVELPFASYDDVSALDALILLRAELGDPDEPTRVATFPPAAMMQRTDVTGRSGPELNELRSRLDRLHSINSTVLVDEGPRRWLMLIRWDALAVRRLEDLVERAGFVDVTVEPSPLAIGRVLPRATTFVRRFASQGNAHHAVLSGGLPVAAGGRIATGRTHPDLDVSTVDVPLAWFEDFLTEAVLGEQLDRVDGSAEANAALTGVDEGPLTLALAGDPYPTYPDADVRSPRRQAVALGAAIGAAGLAGPLRPVDMILPAIGLDDHFDRPWAVERISELPDVEPATAPGALRRLSLRLLPRRRR